MEKWYSLARYWSSVFANRQKEDSRCRHCFSMRYYPSIDISRQYPAQGCDGCYEMEEFLSDAQKLFKEWAADDSEKKE